MQGAVIKPAVVGEGFTQSTLFAMFKHFVFSFALMACALAQYYQNLPVYPGRYPGNYHQGDYPKSIQLRPPYGNPYRRKRFVF